MFRRKAKSAEKNSSGNLLGHILLVVDGAEPSIAAANYAARLASQAESSVTAVYVIDTATLESLLQMHIFVQDEREEFERDLERTGRRYLDYVTTIGKNHGVEVTTELLRGSFHQTILQVAREQKVDGIIIGGWRRTVTRKDTTSVERQLILDNAECPVLVVKKEPE